MATFAAFEAMAPAAFGRWAFSSFLLVLAVNLSFRCYYSIFLMSDFYFGIVRLVINIENFSAAFWHIVAYCLRALGAFLSLGVSLSCFPWTTLI